MALKTVIDLRARITYVTWNWPNQPVPPLLWTTPLTHAADPMQPEPLNVWTTPPCNHGYTSYRDWKSAILCELSHERGMVHNMGVLVNIMSVPCGRGVDFNIEVLLVLVSCKWKLSGPQYWGFWSVLGQCVKEEYCSGQLEVKEEWPTTLGVQVGTVSCMWERVVHNIYNMLYIDHAF